MRRQVCEPRRDVLDKWTENPLLPPCSFPLPILCKKVRPARARARALATAVIIIIIIIIIIIMTLI